VNRVFDYVPRLVEANRAFRVTAADPTLLQKSRYWVPSVTLDQGAEGSCVGHGVVAEYLASPVRGRFVRENRPGPYYAEVGHEEAVAVYNRAKEIDEWEGVDYDGTSVRAGMLVGRERGWWEGFSWAFNMGELRAALELGPVVIGVEWYDSMYETVGRDLVVRGQVVGGHCILVTGYSSRTRSYRLRNSWGTDWGQNGSAYITGTDLDRILFQAGGEAAVPVGRKLA
jgi:hypothetical protein